MKRITDENTLSYLPLTLQTLKYTIKNNSDKVKTLEFSVSLYQTNKTTLKKFHRQISKII